MELFDVKLEAADGASHKENTLRNFDRRNSTLRRKGGKTVPLA